MKKTISTSIGIALGWCALIAFGVYKDFDSAIIILFIALGLATSGATILLGKSNRK